MVNQRLPCPCKNCRNLATHWVQTRNSHLRRHGPFEATTDVTDVSLDRVEDACDGHDDQSQPHSSSVVSLTIDELRQALASTEMVAGQGSKGSTLRSELGSFYFRNMGRPLSENLMKDLLHTLGSFCELPRTVRGLQPKRLSSVHHVKINKVSVCGKCAIFRFEDDSIFGRVVCPNCMHTKLKCLNPRCGTPCVLRGNIAIRRTCES